MNRALIFAWVVMATAASAGTIADTFEVPVGGATPADGFTAFGVTFHFTDNSALYGNVTGMSVAPLSDPVLDGPSSGVLTLEFLQPVTSLSFDFLLGIVAAEIADGVSVALSGPEFAGSTPLTAPTGAPDSWFGVGSFSYVGSPITQAALTFSSSADFFAIDNLVYDQVEFQGSLPVHSPEPGTVALAGVAIALAALRLKAVRR